MCWLILGSFTFLICRLTNDSDLCRSLSHVIKDYLYRAVDQLQEGQENIYSGLQLIDNRITKLTHASENMTVGQREKHQGKSMHLLKRLKLSEYANDSFS